MKKLISILFIVGLMSSNVLIAQKQKANQGQKQRVEALNEKAKTELDLSDSQSKEWDEIQSSFIKELKEMRDDDTVLKEDKKEKMRVLRKEKENRIKALLSDEQMKELIELRKEYANQNKQARENNIGKANKGSQIMKMKEELNLSEDQLEKWDRIVVENRAKMKSINMDESLNEESKKAKMKMTRGEVQAEIMAILTSEQQAMYTTKVDELGRGKHKQKKQISE